ncbi:MAG: response regulator [Bdellovibrionota bacterium]
MSASFEGVRILVAEDESALRNLLVTHFQTRGAQISSAKNGKAAFDLMKYRDFDVVITDIRMDQHGGVQLLQNIHDQISKKPFVAVITGHADPSENALLSMGANVVFFKPFSVRELERTLLLVLGKDAGFATD